MPFFSVLVGFGILLLRARAVTPDSSLSPELKAGSEMNSRVAANLIKNSDLKGNGAWSPFSLGRAMGMLLLGAKGRTKDQIETLYEPQKGESISKNYKAMGDHMKSYNHSREVIIKGSNGIYTDSQFKLLPDYKKAVKEDYGVEPQSIDFSGDPEGAKAVINANVANKTGGMIKEMFESVASSTKAILVSVIFFKGVWKEEFEVRRTKEMDFQVDKDTKVKVQMMHQKTKFRHLRLEDAAVLELPFVGEEMSMIFILPNKTEDLESVEKKVYEMDFAKLFNGSGKVTVKVWIPKFEISHTMSMKEPLTKMGITDVFTEKADLSGFSADKGLFVSQIVQKCVVKVDEKGTKAAVATGLTLMMRSAPPKPVEFKADRPFIYAVVTKATGFILFSGRLVNPTA